MQKDNMGPQGILIAIMRFIIRKKPVNIDKSKIHRILILRLDAIGEVLRTTPIIKNMNKKVSNKTEGTVQITNKFYWIINSKFNWLKYD